MHELLLSGLSAPEVVEALHAEGLPGNVVAVYRVSKALDVALSKGRPRVHENTVGDDHQRGRGRPPGTGKKYSPHRERARALRNQGLSLTAIAAELGISRTQVINLLSDDKPR